MLLENAGSYLVSAYGGDISQSFHRRQSTHDAFPVVSKG